MNVLRLPFLVLVLATPPLRAEDAEKPEKPTPEEIVTAGIRQFHDRMRSPDPEVRKKEFDEAMADRKVIEKLFGDNARLVWPRYEDGLKTMRERMDKGREEFDRKGEIRSVELIDVRKNDVSGRYQRVLQLIPKDIPVYRAVVTYEKGSGGSSSYLVLDDRMWIVRGLEVAPKLIDGDKPAGN